MGIKFEGGVEQMIRVTGTTPHQELPASRPVDYRSQHNPDASDPTCIDPTLIYNPNIITELKRAGVQPVQPKGYTYADLEIYHKRMASDERSDDSDVTLAGLTLSENDPPADPIAFRRMLDD